MKEVMNRRLIIAITMIGLSTSTGWTQGAIPGEPPASAEKSAAADCEKRGQPRIGMTAPQAMETCWGKPARTISRVTHDTLEEQLIYADGRVLKFKNGSLTAILGKQ
jgi:hypothetical protein